MSWSFLLEIGNFSFIGLLKIFLLMESLLNNECLSLCISYHYQSLLFCSSNKVNLHSNDEPLLFWIVDFNEKNPNDLDSINQKFVRKIDFFIFPPPNQIISLNKILCHDSNLKKMAFLGS